MFNQLKGIYALFLIPLLQLATVFLPLFLVSIVLDAQARVFSVPSPQVTTQEPFSQAASAVPLQRTPLTAAASVLDTARRRQSRGTSIIIFILSMTFRERFMW